MTPGGAPPAEEKLDWATFVSLLLLLSSAAASYHFCVLILSAALAAGALLQAGRRKQALLLLLCYALVSFPLDRIVPSSPGGWAIFLGYPRLYAMAAFCLVLAWARHGHRDPRAPRPSRVEGATLGVAFVALVLGGVVSNLRHFKGQFESYPRRLATWSLMAAEPMTAGREVYFSRMDEESFVVDRIGDGPVTVGLPSVDLFHPAVTAGEAEGWLEIAGTTSRIARFRRDASRLSVRDLPIEVEDGEEPAISADGRWLAFIRRERGRGSLWLLDRRGGEPGLPMAGAPRKIVEASRDVLDLAFFPDGQIVFAGRQGDRSKLFAVDPHLPHSPHAPHAPEPRELATSDRSVRNPAVSIDGRWLAYAELDGGNWQLWAMPLPEGPRRRLTEADCNSVSPSWFPDSKTLVYATDCGRGIGHTALAWLAAAP
jgi:hypothetical protein